MFLASFPSSSVATLSPIPHRYLLFKFRAYVAPLQSAPNLSSPKRSLLLDSLRLLEWDKVCDSVAAFAGTSLGREATKSRLWSVSSSFEESKNLLAETNAAVAMLNYGARGIDLSGLDLALVKSASDRAMRGVPMEGLEALAVASLLLFAEMLQSTLKAAMKEDADWYNRFMPLSELIMDFVVNRTLVKSIQQVIDEDGSVKDSASLDLRRSREQVQMLESKLYQLMDSLIRTQSSETSSMEVSNIDGRWCIKSGDDQHTSLTGLLLSSASGVESLIEPISAVPLNDELQQARASVAKAEEAVLSRLTNKMQADLSDIKNLLNAIIQMDVVIARAKYSLAYEGTCPEFSLTSDSGESFSSDGYPPTNGKLFENVHLSNPNQKEWTLYLRKAYHPLLLEKHRENMKKARKDVSDAIAERRRRRLQGGGITSKENLDAHLASLKTKVTDLDGSYPVPVDILITVKTRVVVITGPNTGGKTISLKTVGLAALMAKSGLYVLASEPVKIPWFDSVFADIGDEQSLAQSLSTFSGHLKQISAIQAESTSKSLVLLDEVGAGTNPLEGAALGMSLLEGFAEHALLTLATTHHGELKTLKYSNAAFENACMEFDEVNLKPTYKILWGIPGRSNAINIAERLGLPCTILDNARKLYGTTSAELNETIVDMERFKQDFHHHTHEAQNYLKLSKELHEKLLVAKQKISEHIVIQRYKKMKEISETAVHARSTLRNKVREFRAFNTFPSKINGEIKTTDDTINTVPSNSSPPVEKPKKSHSDKQIQIPEVGDVVHVSSLRKKVTVLKVEASKGEVMVLANNMKLRLKLSDIEA